MELNLKHNSILKKFICIFVLCMFITCGGRIAGYRIFEPPKVHAVAGVDDAVEGGAIIAVLAIIVYTGIIIRDSKVGEGMSTGIVQQMFHDLGDAAYTIQNGTITLTKEGINYVQDRLTLYSHPNLYFRENPVDIPLSDQKQILCDNFNFADYGVYHIVNNNVNSTVDIPTLHCYENGVDKPVTLNCCQNYGASSNFFQDFYLNVHPYNHEDQCNGKWYDTWMMEYLSYQFCTQDLHAYWTGGGYDSCKSTNPFKIAFAPNQFFTITKVMSYNDLAPMVVLPTWTYPSTPKDLSGIKTVTAPTTADQTKIDAIANGYAGVSGQVAVQGATTMAGDMAIATTATATASSNGWPAADSDGLNFKPLQLTGDLVTTKFPFSLPWDLKRVFDSIYTEPEPPKVNIDLRNTSSSVLNQIGINFTLDVRDFPCNDEIIKILRLMILISCVIGILLKTRALLGGDV